jgi:radical SAM protein with 4Fe4S-binding SPASM domain
MKEDILTKYLFAKAYKFEIPISAAFELLDRCNLKCEHCYLPQHVNEGMPIQNVKEVLNDMKKMGVLNLTLTGGEIFTRGDIFEIIEYARSLNMRVILLTNATLLDENRIMQLKKLYITQISTSLYSMNPQIHDSITGVNGSWEKLMTNLDLLKKYGINVQIKTPIMKKNKYEYVAIGNFCAQNGFAYKFSARIFSKNDGDNSPKNMRVAPSDLNAIIRDYDKNEGADLLSKEFTCGALRYSFAVDSSGNVFPCNTYSICVGNVLERSLEEIWNSTEYRKIRNIKKDEIDACISCTLNKYCKRCPAMAYRDHKTVYGCDEDAKSWAICRKERSITDAAKTGVFYR